MVPGVKYWCFLTTAVCFIVACRPGTVKLDTVERKVIIDSVTTMLTRIEADISNKGPVAWLNYFENATDFFMASDGQLLFKDYPTAKGFILNTLVKRIAKVKLGWDHIRVDPLTPEFASVGADFHEDLTAPNGSVLSVNGYFTGTARHSVGGWKLRNANWSIKTPDKNVR